MLILEPTASARQTFSSSLPSGKQALIYTSLFLGIGVLTVPAVISLAYSQRPTGTYLDPRPSQQLAQAVTPTPADLTAKSAEQLVISAQAYLEKAITLSKLTSQTESDKQQIITLLNQSLDLSNQAVITAPSSPQAYLIRARVLASSSSVRTDALQLAQKDLEIAQKLSGGQPVDLPTQVNLLNLTPTQQASLAQDVIIAAPNDDQQASSSAAADSNVYKSTATIAAGQLSVTITNPQISADNYLYIANTTSSNPIFIQNKANGTATIATTNSSAAPITFEYWIVNP